MREVETWEIHAYTPHIIETAHAWLLQLDILDSGFLSHLFIYWTSSNRNLFYF